MKNRISWLALLSFIGLSVSLPTTTFATPRQDPPAAESTCKDNVQLSVWYDGSNFTWSHQIKMTLFVDGRFEVYDRFKNETHPEREITVRGVSKEGDSMVRWLENEGFFALQDKYGEDLGPVDGPSPWYISLCKNGKTKTVMNGVLGNGDPHVGQLIGRVKAMFQNELTARGISIS